MIGALHELKLGLRRLSRSLGFLLSSVACLALGIGVNATMLTFLDIVLFRPPAHVRDAGTVVRLSYRQSGGEFPQAVFCYPAYTDLARGSNAFSAMAAHAYDLSGSSLGSGAAAQRVRLDLVTPGFFPLLGVHPLRGRLFSEAEGDPERPGFVALVSWEFWQRAFGGAEILGRRLPIGQQSYTVVGVLPPRFTGVDLEPVDVWLPAGAFRFLGGSPGWSHDRGLFQWSVVGRLRPGVSVRQARLQATLTYQRASAALGDRHAAERSISLAPVQLGWSPEGGRAARLAAWSAGAGMAVFLTACASVAGLLLLRSLDRRWELAVRLALGASRTSLARLLLGESLLLALLGGVAALAVAWVSRVLLGAFYLPGGFPDVSSADGRALAILVILVLGGALLSGAGPALWALRKGSPAPVLSGGRELDRGRSWLRTVLLATQVAFAFVLLVGAGLFTRSLSNAPRPSPRARSGPRPGGHHGSRCHRVHAGTSRRFLSSGARAGPRSSRSRACNRGSRDSLQYELWRADHHPRPWRSRGDV
jgi:putative ABC transport system permease protein